jgi:hypothetical protein
VELSWGGPEGHQSTTRATFMFWPHEVEGRETGSSAEHDFLPTLQAGCP